MPSTTSSSVSRLFASSTVITPSLPTFAIASAIILPTVVSPFAEIVPTWRISSFDLTFLERFLRSATTASTAFSTPRFRSIGFMPAATERAPSRTIAWARTVAVVVPSPAASLVLEATSRTICAPMFSNLSASSISFATVTPSLVERGAPKLFSITTLRPLGPSVTFTASARMSTPRSIRSRASAPNLTSFAAIGVYLLNADFALCALSGFLRRRLAAFENAHDVGLLHDEEIFAIDFHLGAGPLAEQHELTGFHRGGNELAVVIGGAGADGDHFAFLRLLLDGVGDNDAAGGFLVFFDAADDHAVAKRTEFQGGVSLKSSIFT